MTTQTPAPAAEERRGTLRGSIDGIRSVEIGRASCRERV